jgi:hypothetical protein
MDYSGFPAGGQLLFVKGIGLLFFNHQATPEKMLEPSQ